jgi:hypothetical protein
MMVAKQGEHALAIEQIELLKGKTVIGLELSQAIALQPHVVVVVEVVDAVNRQAAV